MMNFQTRSVAVQMALHARIDAPEAARLHASTSMLAATKHYARVPAHWNPHTHSLYHGHADTEYWSPHASTSLAHISTVLTSLC